MLPEVLVLFCFAFDAELDLAALCSHDHVQCCSHRGIVSRFSWSSALQLVSPMCVAVFVMSAEQVQR